MQRTVISIDPQFMAVALPVLRHMARIDRIEFEPDGMADVFLTLMVDDPRIGERVTMILTAEPGRFTATLEPVDSTETETRNYV